MRARPVALGTAYNGASFAGLIFSPLWVFAIALMGFPAAAAAIGIVTAMVVGMLAARFFARTPAEMGLAPDGDTPGVPGASVTSPRAGPLPGAALWRDFGFITLAIGAALTLFAQIGLIAHLYSLMVPVLGRQWAGIVMGIGTGAGMGGRMLVGVADAGRRRPAARRVHQLRGADRRRRGADPAAGANVPLLLLGVMMFGVGIGNVTSMPPLIAQMEFVKDDVARVVALVVAIGQGTYAFAPAAFGLIRELVWRGRHCVRGRRAGVCTGDRGAAGRASVDEIGARVALQIEQRGEIAVVDARMRGLRDLRLGVIGDTEAGRLDHREIVRAVAGRDGLLRRKAEAVAQFDQRRELGLAPEDRLCDTAGELAVLDDQRVAAVLVEADHRGDSGR